MRSRMLSDEWPWDCCCDGLHTRLCAYVLGLSVRAWAPMGKSMRMYYKDALLLYEPAESKWLLVCVLCHFCLASLTTNQERITAR